MATVGLQFSLHNGSQSARRPLLRVQPLTSYLGLQLLGYHITNGVLALCGLSNDPLYNVTVHY